MSIRHEGTHIVVNCEGCAFEAEGDTMESGRHSYRATVGRAQRHANLTGHELQADVTQIKTIIPAEANPK